MCINLPLALWMLLSFFEGLPKDIEEAAMVDGCSHLGVLLRIVLPLALPGIAVTTLLCFLFSWNEVLFALILTGLNTKTASIAIYNYLTWVEIKWGELSSAAILIMLPPILITFLAQKYIARGLMIGGALKR
jgi:multiple sugar transport system permease protein